MNKHVAILIYLLMDIAWISLNAKFYNKSIRKIQNKDIKIKTIPALLSYALLVLNIYTILIPRLKNKWEFSLSGLIIYGVYNMTNLATIEDYTVEMSIIDTFWGAFSHFFIGYLILG